MLYDLGGELSIGVLAGRQKEKDLSVLQ